MGAMGNFIDELKWRGMIHDIMPGTEELLDSGMCSGYIGFDPTAPSLHIGNLVQIMMLVHFQRSGHKPYVLVGGATGMIGDPSGKSEERNLLDEESLRINESSIKKQLAKFLVFEEISNHAVMVNNYDWFKDRGFLEFLRDIGKHLTINYMLAKESVKNRIEAGISFTEFSYQILQGYDFLYLYQNHGVKFQMGGSDQWGNITTGTELIRRKANGEAFALTTPLITKVDGSKFGKTEEGNVWLDGEMTSPYKFYQFWLNCSDEDSTKLIKIFSIKGKEEIFDLESKHRNAPHERILQQVLAEEITARVHSEEELEQAKIASRILFGKSTKEDLESLDEKLILSVFEGVPQTEISKGNLNQDILQFLSEGTNGVVFKSKAEARRMIEGGGLSFNKTKIDSIEKAPEYNLLQGKFLLIQKGKKNYYLIKVVD
jgi:tyrosyl-tRNA synthetase